jgi:uncharacterized membrane protein
MNILQAIKRRSKNYFLSGLLLVVPLVITILVIKAIFNFLDSLLLPYLQPYLGEWLVIPGVGILITVLSIYFVGILVTNFIGRKFVNLGERLLLRIPIAKSIYGSVKQILQTFSFQEKQSIKKVVMVEYPKSDVWSIGLVNGEIIHPQSGESMYNILIIASINPASGFFIIVPKTKTILLDITVEDAMKWIVSGGIVTPEIYKQKRQELLSAKQKD